MPVGEVEVWGSSSRNARILPGTDEDKSLCNNRPNTGYMNHTLTPPSLITDINFKASLK